MASARAIFQAHIDDLLLESLPFDLQWVSTGAVGLFTRTSLLVGDNTITIPAGTTLVCLVPPTTSSAITKVKGAGGDTGVTIRRNVPAILTWESGSIILNVSVQVDNFLILFI